MDILEAAEHYPNYARTRCMLDDERWPCAAWQWLRRHVGILREPLPEHPYMWSDHCAECAINRPGRV